MNNRLYRCPEAGFNGMGTPDVPDRMDPQYGDLVPPENNIPANGLGTVDSETCMTMNRTWGLSAHDHAWKSPEKLIRNLIDISSKGGNYPLNVGPTGDGTIPPESVERMEAIGAWLKENGDAIYGTTPNPFETSTFDRRVTKRQCHLPPRLQAPRKQHHHSSCESHQGHPPRRKQTARRQIPGRRHPHFPARNTLRPDRDRDQGGVRIEVRGNRGIFPE